MVQESSLIGGQGVAEKKTFKARLRKERKRLAKKTSPNRESKYHVRQEKRRGIRNLPRGV